MYEITLYKVMAVPVMGYVVFSPVTPCTKDALAAMDEAVKDPSGIRSLLRANFSFSGIATVASKWLVKSHKPSSQPFKIDVFKAYCSDLLKGMIAMFDLGLKEADSLFKLRQCILEMNKSIVGIGAPALARMTDDEAKEIVESLDTDLIMRLFDQVKALDGTPISHVVEAGMDATDLAYLRLPGALKSTLTLLQKLGGKSAVALTFFCVKRASISLGRQLSESEFVLIKARFSGFIVMQPRPDEALRRFDALGLGQEFSLIFSQLMTKALGVNEPVQRGFFNFSGALDLMRHCCDKDKVGKLLSLSYHLEPVLVRDDRVLSRGFDLMDQKFFLLLMNKMADKYPKSPISAKRMELLEQFSSLLGVPFNGQPVQTLFRTAFIRAGIVEWQTSVFRSDI